MPDLAQRLYDLEITARAARSAARNYRATQPGSLPGGTDLLLCLVDHYEPQIGRPGPGVSRARVEDWLERYPKIAARHRDADGRMPPHSFFYPWDEYDPWELERLAELCHAGFGELDLHLHHADDTEETLRAKLRAAVSFYNAAGVLSTWPDGRPAWGFIHGNWALDNSRHEGGRNFCGVNRELTVLREEGCYADFTFPAWQHRAQPRWTNQIAYAVDDPRPKSYERATPSRVGTPPPAESLMLVHGPLLPFKRGSRPAMDDGDLAHYRRFSPDRLDRWVRAGVHVQGRPDRIFIKLHTHGAADENRRALLGEDLEALFADAEERYNDGTRFRLHYVTAREVFNIVKATEAGADLTVDAARNWILPAPEGAGAVTQGQVSSD